MSFVSLLKSKGEAFNASKPLITTLEVESRTNLKSLRTDGGGEYISHECKAFAKDKASSISINLLPPTAQNKTVSMNV